MSNEHDLKRRFDRDGFVVIRGFVRGQELDELQDAIDRYLARISELPRVDVMFEDRNRPESLKQLAHMKENDDYFAALMDSPKWIGLAEKLLKDRVLPQEVEWFNKAPGANVATPPHQDGYYFMLEPNEAVTMWLALDPVDESNGCVRYIPGSHRSGLRLHGRTQVLGFSQGIRDYGAEDHSAELPIGAEPGDLLAHHAGTIHRADRNDSARQRRSLGFIYYASRAQQDRRRLAEYQQKLNQELQVAQKL
jgi:phytanoyl-CoA hydroxylase